MKTVKAEWEEYARLVLPADAPPVQITETRRAFYAGAWSMLMQSSELGDDSVSEEQGVIALEWWRREIEAFHRAVQDGRA